LQQLASLLWELSSRVPYRITQCDLLPDRGDISTLRLVLNLATLGDAWLS